VHGKVTGKYRLENGNLGLVVEDAATRRRYHVEFRDNYMGESVARDPAADAHVVELFLGCPEADLDVSEAFAIGELGKGQAEKLVPARKALDLVVAVVALYALAKLVDGEEIHQLRENSPTSIHQPSPSAGVQKYGILENRSSNRLRSFSLVEPR